MTSEDIKHQLIIIKDDRYEDTLYNDRAVAKEWQIGSTARDICVSQALGRKTEHTENNQARQSLFCFIDRKKARRAQCGILESLQRGIRFWGHKQNWWCPLADVAGS